MLFVCPTQTWNGTTRTDIVYNDAAAVAATTTITTTGYDDTNHDNITKIKKEQLPTHQHQRT